MSHVANADGAADFALCGGRDSSRDWDLRLLAAAAMRQKSKPMRLNYFSGRSLALIHPRLRVNASSHGLNLKVGHRR